MKQVKYVQKDDISHILDRSETYVGYKGIKNTIDYVAICKSDTEYSVIKQKIDYSPALLRVFIEGLSNAIDNVERSKEQNIPCNSIKVEVNEETGETSIWNDGFYIPITKSNDNNVYNHTLIFGMLRTGSNYDDTETRFTSGRNGLGIKLCNVFSKEFNVKGLDPKEGKILEQTWTNNMRDVKDPKVSSTKLKTGYTKITYIPDFKQFGLDGYTKDIIGLYLKYTLDAAMLTKVKVFWNGNQLPVNTIQSYASLYQETDSESICIKSKDADVLLSSQTKGEFEAISFVNGIMTKKGGTHVEPFIESLLRPIVDKFNAKKKDKTVTLREVKPFFKIFVNARVCNPVFSSQEKHELEHPKLQPKISASDIKKILKWSVLQDIEASVKDKDMSALKNATKKKKGYIKIEKLDNANNYQKNGHQCTLILCEGDSAKTYADAGIETGVYGKSGKDWFGTMSLTGKCLNVRKCAPEAISSNKVITNLVKALGLEYGKDYSLEDNYKKLNYGRVILLTDQDVDGLHISSLIMNFFHCLFPTILERDDPYVVSLCTPIVRIFMKTKPDKLFYSLENFHKYARGEDPNFIKTKSKYYKGLGTTKIEDVPDTFGKKIIEYKNDSKTTETMVKVFDKKYADVRKKWMEEYTPGTDIGLDCPESNITMDISKFLDTEMIKFSIDDCKRSIPCLVDGLKESQRKVIYALKKRKLSYNKQSIKVAQFAGYVAEHTNYHHGEQNLYDTITKMAQDFVNSNNIPLLYRDGGFGSRRVLGSDAASARYIYTKMDELTNLIFREEDDILLDYINDDGDSVEPKFYVPIIPMILVNGCSGIGTGWSTDIPLFNPKDILESVRCWIENDGEIYLNDPDTDQDICVLPELVPWYRGFTGIIEPIGKDKYSCKGNIERTGKTKVKVTEIPVDMSIDKFKTLCEDWTLNASIKSFKNNSGPNKVEFSITESEDGLICNVNNMKLVSKINTTNMVLFDTKDRLKKYEIWEIINEFCKVRILFYKKRKEHQLAELKSELSLVENRARFIDEVIKKELPFMDVHEKDILTALHSKGYAMHNRKNTQEDDDEDVVDSSLKSLRDGYAYLLQMQFRTLTREKIAKLRNDMEKLQERIDTLMKTSEKELWFSDLQEFEKQYDKWVVKRGASTKSKKISKE